MTPSIQAMADLGQKANTSRSSTSNHHRRRRAAANRNRRLPRIRRRSKAKSDSEKVWNVIMGVIPLFGPYVASRLTGQPGIMDAFYVTTYIGVVARIAEIKTKKHYLLTILEWFVPMVVALAGVLLLFVLTPWFGIIMSIILALSLVIALIKSYQEIWQALLYLLHIAITLTTAAWSCLRNIRRRLCAKADKDDSPV